MSETELKARIEALKRSTKAARLRQLMPSIEAKLAEGVRAAEIVEALRHGGLELTIATFRNYLYQYRARHPNKSTERPEVPGGPQTAGAPASPRPEVCVSQESAPPATDGGPPPPREPLSMQELDRLMKPDPAELAERIARYERIAIEKERSRR
ncbi:conjugal transfer protein TraD [Pandoraea sputorum]|uniref:Conjugal transfer protein TraD n=1 Tax=Pandoraea sputorum TaxID=93222 RepID=A0A5E5BJD3_9BURK|nr:conjugal transfer protein TraD [Pandoraea sputorum]VVE85397.1 conjugal transfer protein TraD [Pandoraea sputorum]